uniref:Uncharacterized protein n=1 Tax=Scytodes thoracica TaxID=1112478 RepID=A0A0A0VA81_SCYTH|nr:hypothetical protein [Scytodes thoracica]
MRPFKMHTSTYTHLPAVLVRTIYKALNIYYCFFKNICDRTLKIKQQPLSTTKQ